MSHKRVLYSLILSCIMTTASINCVATMNLYAAPSNYSMNSTVTLFYNGITMKCSYIDRSKHTLKVDEAKFDRKAIQGNLVIPYEVEQDGIKYHIIELGTESFRLGNGLAGKVIKTYDTITISEGIEVIGKQAVQGHFGVTRLILPKSLKKICHGAFFKTAQSISELDVPSNVIVEDHAFGNRNWGVFFGKIINLPSYINSSNQKEYGIYSRSLASNSTQEEQISQVSPEQNNSQSSPSVKQNNKTLAKSQDHSAKTIPSQNAKPATTPTSDVDINIPSIPASNENTFAVIIANENYQSEVKVDYAINDGKIFQTYCHKVLGLPSDNIHFVQDATLNNIIAEIDWLDKIAKAYGADAKFIIYYSGHGIPDEATGQSYLLPVDGKGSILRTAYSLKEFYQSLAAMPVQNTTVFMDACFSGAKRGSGMLTAARGVAIRAKAEVPKGKLVVFSAAHGDETAYPYKDKQHGLFTYYLLKKLKETKGNATLGELSDFVTTQVSRKSIVANGKSQTPSTLTSTAMSASWRKVKLK